MDNNKKLYINDKDFIAYNKFIPDSYNGQNKLRVGVVFLSGYMSDMQGGKATFLEKICIEKQIPFVRFDYSGCGLSSGNFMDGSISKWNADTIRIIDDFDEVEKIILVGSSMGGWIMLLAALARKNKICCLVGIASAPDFTEDLMWNILPIEAQNEVTHNSFYKMKTDYCGDPNNLEAEDSFYTITKLLIEDGRKNMLLNKEEQINLSMPVSLIHGMNDEDVPYKYSILLKEKLASKNVEVILQKSGTHRMSEPENLELIAQVLEEKLSNV